MTRKGDRQWKQDGIQLRADAVRWMRKGTVGRGRDAEGIGGKGGGRAVCSIHAVAGAAAAAAAGAVVAASASAPVRRSSCIVVQSSVPTNRFLS